MTDRALAPRTIAPVKQDGVPLHTVRIIWC